MGRWEKLNHVGEGIMPGKSTVYGRSYKKTEIARLYRCEPCTQVCEDDNGVWFCLRVNKPVLWVMECEDRVVSNYEIRVDGDDNE